MKNDLFWWPFSHTIILRQSSQFLPRSPPLSQRGRFHWLSIKNENLERERKKRSWYRGQNMIRSNKRRHKSLEGIEAAGTEVRDTHHVLHLTPTLPLTVALISLKIPTWFTHQIKQRFVSFLYCAQYLKSDKIELFTPFLKDTGQTPK